jgi:hypothetical protein
MSTLIREVISTTRYVSAFGTITGQVCEQMRSLFRRDI